MLADEVDLVLAIAVAPKPSSGSVKLGTVLVTNRSVPERDRHVITIEPRPVELVGISGSSHPVLGSRVSAVTSVQLPRQEALKSWGSLIDEGPASFLASRVGLSKVQLLIVVENIAFAVVRRH